MKERDIKECNLPDIVDFLNLTRTIDRQIDFFKSTKIPCKYNNIVREAARTLGVKAIEFSEGDK